MKVLKIIKKLKGELIMLFKKKVISKVSYYDWVSRLNSSLKDSVQHVYLSDREDSFENIVRVFRSKTKSTLSLIKKADVKVDIHGVYVLNHFNNDKIYLLSFCNNKITNVPTDESLTHIGCEEYIVNVLEETYTHHIAKLKDQQRRLEKELQEVTLKQERLTDLISAFTPVIVKTPKAETVSEKPESKE
jgi:hypothetical protein